MVTDRVGHDHGFLSYVGGPVCPENSNAKWEVSVFHNQTETFTWAYDTLLRVECVEAPSLPANTESSTAGGEIISLPSVRGMVRGSDVSPVITVLSIICILLIAVLVTIFCRKFYKAWSQGAHGKQLFTESF